ncbi:RusA family crossover junction endodeoxyribonuclease [Dehalobacter sp.]|uniref:RusA family crossover junction endodeoxyribonuclease n=1 Tax=Dehalobacter sp. TaxID=1962289 RepID=UPI00258B76A9|nr:RusA family crossover junction endodeoxyribonuclease [Dehalobacter sp.]MDJ0305114.1 RusA family crossover junction endodeoxyribonuclease [Dehalobacter sp.]
MQLNIINPPNARLRPIYPEEVSASPYRPSLTADYQEDINFEFVKAINRQNKVNNFPLGLEVSMAIKVQSSRELNLIGVAKNVFDALNKRAYRDDVVIESFRIDQVTGIKDRTDIRVICGKRITPIRLDESVLDPYTELSFTVEGQISDTIIPIPGYGHMLQVDQLSLANDSILRPIIETEFNQGSPQPYSGDIGISFDIMTNSLRTDIDNIVLDYLCNMNGIVFTRCHQIKSMHATIDRCMHGTLQQEGCIINISLI